MNMKRIFDNLCPRSLRFQLLLGALTLSGLGSFDAWAAEPLPRPANPAADAVPQSTAVTPAESKVGDDYVIGPGDTCRCTSGAILS
jgi:hypothetical protein